MSDCHCIQDGSESQCMVNSYVRTTEDILRYAYKTLSSALDMKYYEVRVYIMNKNSSVGKAPFQDNVIIESQLSSGLLDFNLG